MSKVSVSVLILLVVAPVTLITLLALSGRPSASSGSWPTVESMKRHGHTRTLTVWNNTGTFVGEKHHALWWDESRQYWFCGMNTSRVRMFDDGKLPLPLVFDPLLMPPVFVLRDGENAARYKGPMRAFLRDGRETEHYRHDNMIVVVVQDGSDDGTALHPDTLGAPAIDGLAVDIDFVW